VTLEANGGLLSTKVMTEERLVKGSHIVQAERWVDARLGKGTFQELTRPAGENWRIILPMAWYEVDVVEAALEQVSGKLRVSAEDITIEVARANAEADLTSIYRVFLRVAQPQRGTHRAIRIVLR
jgi:hypothetical protein